MKSVVTSITQSSKGPLPHREVKEEESHLRAAWIKWKHLKEQVKGKKWAECPADFVADHVRAVAKDLRLQFEEETPSKITSMFSVTLAEKNIEKFELSSSWLSGNASVSLSFSRHPVTELEIEKEFGTSFVLKLPPDSDEAAARKALSDWSEEPSSARFIFDPVTQLPDDEVKVLTSMVESQLPAPSDLDILIGAATALIIWKKMEAVNATDSTFSFEGLSHGENKIWPDQKMVVNAKANLFDQLEQTLIEEGDFVEAIITTPAKPRHRTP